jgi:tRNA(Ile)-lysidine synthase
MLCGSRLPGKVKISYGGDDMQDIQQRFAAALDALRPGSTLVVGVSGGLDSMALLELLRSSGRRLVVAHFNHQLRGAESDGDEAFVREQAEKRGLEFRVGRGDARAEAKGVSIEMAARKLRHAFLAQVAREVKADIVLAHHADDQVELVLMRARRGVEGYGAAGMRDVAVSSVDSSVRILRPLLPFRKSELREFVEARQIPFREDRSNALLEAERNRMRHKTIPSLREEFGPEFEGELLRHVATMRGNDDAWREAANAWVDGRFSELPERLQKEIVVVQLERRGVAPSGKVLEALLANVGKTVTVGPNLFVTLRPNGILEEARDPNRPEPLRLDLHLGDWKAEFAGGTLEWSINNVEEVDLSPGTGVMVFDAEVVGQFATLRYPEEGDRIRLSGRSSARPLFDVLARNKIPREKRDSVVVAEDRDGQIFWVEGLRITEDFKVTKITSFALEWKWTREAP